MALRLFDGRPWGRPSARIVVVCLRVEEIAQRQRVLKSRGVSFRQQLT
jgi:hypothetical protein